MVRSTHVSVGTSYVALSVKKGPASGQVWTQLQAHAKVYLASTIKWPDVAVFGGLFQLELSLEVTLSL